MSLHSRHVGPSTLFNGLNAIHAIAQQTPEDAFELPSDNGWRLDHGDHQGEEYAGTYDLSALNARADGDDLSYVTTPSIRATIAEDAERDLTAITPSQAERALFNSLVFTPEKLNTTNINTDTEYHAKYTGTGGVILVRTVRRTDVQEMIIASFDTMHDAETAAQALNEHEGY